MMKETQTDRQRFIPWFALIFCWVLTAVTSYYVFHEIRARARQRFEREAMDVSSAIQARIEGYITLLHGGSGLFAINRRITREQFHNYVTRLELSRHYPAIRAFGYSAHVRANALTNFLERLQAEGASDLVVRPPGPRPDYDLVVYSEPQDARNMASIGYDLSTDPARLSAMQQAAETGTPAASGKVTLFPETGQAQQSGFVLFVPLYSSGNIPSNAEERAASLDGFIFGSFRAADFFGRLFSPEEKPNLSFEVYDGAPDKDRLLHRFAPSTVPAKIRFSRLYNLEVADRNWSIKLYGTPVAGGISAPGVAGAILVAGGLISLILFRLLQAEWAARRAGELGATDLKRSELAFKESEEKLRVTLASIGDAVITANIQGTVEFMNAVAEHLTGWRLAEARGRALEEVFVIRQEGTNEAAPSPVEKVVQSGKVIGLANHTELVARDRAVRAIDDSAAPILNRAGEIIGVVLVFHDVTEQRQTQRRIEAQSSLTQVLGRTHNLAEAAPGIVELLCKALHFDIGIYWRFDEKAGVAIPISIWSSNPERFGRFRAVSEAFRPRKGEGIPGSVWQSGKMHWLPDLSLTDYPRAEVARECGLLSAFGFAVREDDQVTGAVEVFGTVTGELDEEFRKFLTAFGLQIGQVNKRWAAEEALRVSEEVHRMIAETAADCIVTIDEHSTIVTANQGAMRIFGYAPEELIGTDMALLMPERLRDFHHKGIRRFIETGQRNIPWDGIALPGLHRDGREIPLEISFGLGAKKSGQSLFTGIIRDVSERKKAEDALRRSQQQLQLITDALPVLISFIDSEDRYQFNNKAFETWFGLSREEMLGRPVKEILGEEAFDLFSPKLREAQTGREVVFEAEVKYPRIGRRYVRINYIPHFSAPGKVDGTYVLVTDLTLRKKTEDAAQFLADAAKALSQSLDYEQTLHHIAEWAVPKIADWCTVDMLRPGGGELRRLSVVHSRKEKVNLANELLERYPARKGDPHGVPNTLRTGQSELYHEISPEVLQAVAQDPSHLAILTGLGLKSAMIVPIKARGKIFGAISFASEREDRLYTTEDLVLAEELASRVGLAIDNALLYREAQQEIAERKQTEEALRESEEKFRLFVERAKDYAIIMLDGEGKISSWNPGAEAILGYREEEILGKSSAALFSPEDRAAGLPDQELQEAMAHGQVQDERWQVRKDSTRFWATSSIIALRTLSGALRGYTKIMRDVTERKRGDEAIRKLNEELEERVQRRTVDLRETNQQLEEFTYTVAHDLRGPLRAMQGFSQALMEDYGPALDATGHDYVRRIGLAAQRMDILIQDLLTYSKLTRADLSLLPVELGTAVRNSLDQFSLQIERLHATVEIAPDLPKVRAHPGTLEHLLGNLIGNALKFVSPGLKPAIRIWAEKRDRNIIRVWIEDNGIGIAPEHQEKIFGIFERLHSNESYEGTGIGLAIVRKAAERMSGQVGLQSSVGKGSRFWVDLPYAG